jgi:hypothetical protein
MMPSSSRRAFFLSAATALATPSARAQGSQPERINFEAPNAFQPMLTGQGGPVAWSVIDDPGASGRKVLAQTSADRTDYRFSLAVFDRPVLQDLDVAVRFKPVSGEVDRAAGIAVRLADRDNYYVVRANALEDNVRLYRVLKGNRQQFAGANAKVPSGVWQELRLVVRGNRFEVFFAGRSLYSATDATFPGPGRVALWTKADSVTWFDDLRISSL